MKMINDSLEYEAELFDRFDTFSDNERVQFLEILNNSNFVPDGIVISNIKEISNYNENIIEGFFNILISFIFKLDFESKTNLTVDSMEHYLNYHFLTLKLRELNSDNLYTISKYVKETFSIEGNNWKSYNYVTLTSNNDKFLIRCERKDFLKYFLNVY